MGLDVNAGVATESKVMVGSDTEMVGVTEKLEVTVGSEAEMVGGTESGVDMEVQTDLEQMVDLSRTVGVVAGAEVGMRSVITTARGDVGAVIRLGCNKDLCSRRSKYKSYGALRGCDLGVRDCLQVYYGK